MVNNNGGEREKYENTSSIDPLQIFAMLLGALAARKIDKKLVITGEEFNNILNNVEDLDIKKDSNGNFIVTVVVPVEG